MSTTRVPSDLNDTEALINADHDGLLRAVSMAGAQVRATAAAVDEGALDELRTGDRPRSVIWVAGRGPAETAGAILAATLGGSAAEPIVTAPEVPPWIGPLDVLVVAGNDPGDPVLAADVKHSFDTLMGPYTSPAYKTVFFYVDKDTWQVRRVLILDGQGNRNRFDFSKPRVNEPVSAELFKFTPPPGTTMGVGGAGGGGAGGAMP